MSRFGSFGFRSYDRRESAGAVAVYNARRSRLETPVRAVVDLDAIASNYRFLARPRRGPAGGLLRRQGGRLRARRGSGRAEARPRGRRPFAVANPEEGVGAAAGGLAGEILLLSRAGARPTLARLARLRPDPTLYDRAQAEASPGDAERRPTPLRSTSSSTRGWAARVSGPEELGTVAAIASRGARALRLAGTFANLSRGRRPVLARNGAAGRAVRAAASPAARRRGRPRASRMLANSAGDPRTSRPRGSTRCVPGSRSTASRRRAPATDRRLRPAMTVETRVIAVRRVPAGTPLGYGGRFVTARDDGRSRFFPSAIMTASAQLFGTRSRFCYGGGGRPWWDPSAWTSLSWTRPTRRAGRGDRAVCLGSDGGATRDGLGSGPRRRHDSLRDPLRHRSARAPGSTPGPGRDRPLPRGDRPRGPRLPRGARTVLLDARPDRDLGSAAALRRAASSSARWSRVGVNSIPVVFLTTLFTGHGPGAPDLQRVRAFQRGEPRGQRRGALAAPRALAGPLGADGAGRVGSAMAAEIGSMRVTEQIDALKALGTEPVQYLVVPRVIASVLMMPLLVVMGDVVGMYGGYFVAVQLLGANPVTYYESSFECLDMIDFTSGLIKAAVFGLIFSVVACVRGYYTEGGAEGVGRSTTQAVVAASLAILLDRLLPDEASVLSGSTRSRACARHGAGKLRVEDLHKSFGGTAVLDGINLSVAPGGVAGDRGPLGNREERAAQAPDRSRAPGQRPCLRRRPGPLGPRLDRAQPDAQEVRHVVPGRRALRLDDRLRQRGVSAAALGPHAGPGSAEGRGVPRARAAAGCRDEAALAALGGHAASGRVRPGHRPRAGDPPLRRAEHGPRSDHDRRHRGSDPRHPEAAAADGRHDHPSHARARARSATGSRFFLAGISCSMRVPRSSWRRRIRPCVSSWKGGPKAR